MNDESKQEIAGLVDLQTFAASDPPVGSLLLKGMLAIARQLIRLNDTLQGELGVRTREEI